jgi:hypothetical protein
MAGTVQKETDKQKKRRGPQPPPPSPANIANLLQGPMQLAEGSGYLRLSEPVTRRLADAGEIQWVDAEADVALLWGPSVKAYAESRIVTGRRPSLAPAPEWGKRKRGGPANSEKMATPIDGESPS